MPLLLTLKKGSAMINLVLRKIGQDLNTTTIIITTDKMKSSMSSMIFSKHFSEEFLGIAGKVKDISERTCVINQLSVQ